MRRLELVCAVGWDRRHADRTCVALDGAIALGFTRVSIQGCQAHCAASSLRHPWYQGGLGHPEVSFLPGLRLVDVRPRRGRALAHRRCAGPVTNATRALAASVDLTLMA